MYAKILVAMSLEHGLGPTALQVARKLLTDGGSITALHVHEAVQDSVRAYLDEAVIKKARAESRERLDERVASEGDVTGVTLIGHPAQTILAYAKENDFDCIIIGSHKPGLEDLLLGSTSARVVRHATCAVHVIRAAV